MTKPDILDGVKSILFYGDSLTDGSSYPDFIVNTLNRAWPGSGFGIMNAGICGNTAADLVARLQADVLARRPDMVVVMIGANDCLGNRPVRDYRDDLRGIVAALLGAGIKVMLVRPSHLADPVMGERLGGYLAAVDEVAAGHGLLAADAHGEFLRGAAAGREMLGPDGVHHGRDGFEGVARAVLDALGLRGVPVDKAIRPWPGLLTAWEMSGPAPDGECDPRKATGWKQYDADALAAGQEWFNVDFMRRGGWMPHSDAEKEHPVRYGRTYYDAPSAGLYELRLGGSAPLLIWLNGRKAWESQVFHGFHPDADRMPVRMKKGRNEIVAASRFLVFVGVGPRDDSRA